MAAETHVVPFGCLRTSKMFKALIPGPRPKPRTKLLIVIPTCPGCGDEHAILDKFGREARPNEIVDVDLVPAPVVVPPRIPSRYNGASDRGAKVSDADVLAAIPTNRPAPASDLARRFGLTLGRTVVERVERINERAVVAWGHPVVQISRRDSGRRELLLQRNGEASALPEYEKSPPRTDDEILAAIPDEWTEATNVAAALEFSYRTLKNRLLNIRWHPTIPPETRLGAKRRLEVRMPPRAGAASVSPTNPERQEVAA